MSKNKVWQDVMYLASCAVNNTIPELSRIEAMDIDLVYSLASGHMIKAMVAMAFESAGYKDSRSGSAIASSIRKTVLFEKALSEIKCALEKQGIWYFPIKGVVLKDYYPKIGMREFSDYDILFDSSFREEVKAIMEQMGFLVKLYGVYNQDVYYKDPVLNFEMHVSLFNSTYVMGRAANYDKIFNYYQNEREKLLGEGLEKHYSPEDFYIFLVAHEYKHYSVSGTGLRALLDNYVFLKKYGIDNLDMDYITAELEKMEIADFEKQIRNLAMHFFGDGGNDLTESEYEMLRYIVTSGTYGTENNRVSHILKRKKWSKPRYMLHRLAVPFNKSNPEYKEFERGYPTFYKYKILLPFLPPIRLVSALFGGRLKKELKMIRSSRSSS